MPVILRMSCWAPIPRRPGCPCRACIRSATGAGERLLRVLSLYEPLELSDSHQAHSGNLVSSDLRTRLDRIHDRLLQVARYRQFIWDWVREPLVSIVHRRLLLRSRQLSPERRGVPRCHERVTTHARRSRIPANVHGRKVLVRPPSPNINGHRRTLPSGL